MRIFLQILGVILLIPAVAMLTIKLDKQNDDGPSILFPGGAFTSGTFHQGPEPDWSFTDDIAVIELLLEEQGTSRRIFIAESGGKVYIPSGYMRSTLGRIWKEWAIEADAGDGLAEIRIGKMRFERQLKRIKEGPELTGVVTKMAEKYGAGATPEAIATSLESIKNGDTWIFEMAPREASIGGNSNES